MENDPRDWNWDEVVRQCLLEDAIDDGGGKYHALLLGSVMSIFPSGKYWTCFASSNVTADEADADVEYMDALEDCASKAGGWLVQGLNGDLCDMFFCMSAEDDEEEDGDDYDYDE